MKDIVMIILDSYVCDEVSGYVVLKTRNSYSVQAPETSCYSAVLII
jgi:hypothetical protein